MLITSGNEFIQCFDVLHLYKTSSLTLVRILKKYILILTLYNVSFSTMGGKYSTDETLDISLMVMSLCSSVNVPFLYLVNNSDNVISIVK